MNKFIIALAATTALAATAPAAAQFGGYSNTNMELRTDRLQAQLQAGVRSGAITRAEATPLREQLRQLSRLERQYAQGGFTVEERTDLQNRRASLRQSIRMAATTGDRRFDRRDRDDRWSDGRDCPPGLERRDNGCLPPGQVGRDDVNGRFGDPRWDSREMIDQNRDGYDDRDLNRDRRIDDQEWRMAQERYGNDGRDNGRFGDQRWDSRETIDQNRDGYDDRDLNRDRRIDDQEWRMAQERYGNGGVYNRDYEAGNPPRGGIGGLIDRVLGGGGLQVGQRVSGNLGPVPYAYRDQFRDGNGVYYRADDRAIYQIDARTDTVVRIYGLNR